MILQPNILLIIADQQRTDTLGFMGKTPCRTPNLDRLAENGVAFDRAITPSPLCGPARCAVFSGQYPHQVPGRPEPGSQGPLVNGEFDPTAQDMLLNDYSCLAEPTLTRVLKERDYHTAYAGKWHLGNDILGDWFDQYDGNVNARYVDWLREQGLPETGWPLNDAEVRTTRTPRMSIPHTKPSPLRPEQTNDAWITDIALRFLGDRPKDQPFFAVCGFNGPHPPFMIPEPYYSMYDPADVPEPANFLWSEDEPECKQRSFYRQLWQDHGEDWDAWKKSVAVYWGFCTLIDDQVGRLIRCLEDQKVLDNTLVIYCSDHGEMLGQHGLWHKMQPYEEALRVPLILRGPRLPAGARSQANASLLDIAPTILSTVGITPPDAYEGRNLAEVCDESQPGHDSHTIFSEHKPLGAFHGETDWRLASDGRYKFVWNRDDRNELYDLASDPWELRNCADDPAMRAVRERLEGDLREWMERTGDPLAGESVQ